MLFSIPLYEFLRVALGRFAYPFDLEWTEGGMLINAQRVLDHQPLYAPPSIDFIPFMYPPGYHAWVAALFRLAGQGYAAPRLGSIAATMGTGLLIFLLARRTGSSTPLALAWSGIWFASYSHSGFFFDLVRVDALHTFLLVAAVSALLADNRRARRGTLIVLILLTVAAVLVKQNALVYSVALVAGVAIGSGWRRAALYAGAVAGTLALVVLAMQYRSDGWFWVYTVSLPGRNGLNWDKVLHIVGGRGLGGLPIGWLALPGLAALASPGEPRGEESTAPAAPPWKSLALILVAALVSDIGMAGHTWGYVNVHMPLDAVLVLVAACGAPALSRALRSRDGAVPLWLLVGMAAQVWALSFRIDAQLPSALARADSEGAVARLAATEGRALAPEFPWILRQAGKDTCYHMSALSDLERAVSKGLTIDLSGLPAEARRSSTAYLAGNHGPPPRLASLFDASRAQPFAADNPEWPPLDGVHTRPLQILPRKASSDLPPERVTPTEPGAGSSERRPDTPR